MHGLCLLSPVLSFTSESTLRTPILSIFLIPLLRFLSDSLSSFWSCYLSYLLIPFVLFQFIPAYSLQSNPSCFHATDNHVAPFSTCSRIMCQLNLMSLRSLLCLSSDISSGSAPYLRTLPVYKPAVSVDTNQSDYFVSLHSYSYLRIRLLRLSYFVFTPYRFSD